MKKWIVILVIVALCAAARAARSEEGGGAADAEREYLVLVLMFGMGEGVGMSLSDYTEGVEQVIEIIRKESGLNLTFDFVGNEEIGYDESLELLANELVERGDFAYINHQYYNRTLELGAPVKLLAIPTMGGKKTYSNCLYVRGDSELKTLEDIQNKKLAIGPGTDSEWLIKDFRDIGIESPPDMFFDVVDAPDFPSHLYALANDRADAMLLSDYWVAILSFFDTRFKKLVPLACGGEYYNNALFVYRETVPERATAKIFDIFKNFASIKAVRKLAIYPFVKKLKLSVAEVKEEDAAAIEKQEMERLEWKGKYDTWKAASEKRREILGSE